MAKRIYRGPNSRQPLTVSDKAVADPYLPGTFVIEGASLLTQATAGVGRLRILSDRDFYSTGHFDAVDPLKVPYVVGDTAVAYLPETGQRYQCAVEQATYTYGQELTVSISGRLTAANAGQVVIAFFVDTAGSKTAGTLCDVEIAANYNKI